MTSRGRKKLGRRARKELLYLGALLLLGVARLLPARALDAVSEFAGRCAFRLLGRERRKTLDNLAAAYGGAKGPAERRRIGRELFVNLGRNMAELALYHRLDAPRLRGLIRMEGREIVDRELARRGSSSPGTSGIGS